MPEMTLPDGRQLCWAEQGDPRGRPVLTFHGTLGSRLSRYPFASDLLSRGVRQISADRPGFGRSSRQEGRTVASAAKDAKALLDELGLDRVGILGGSGGGPHALAVAALLPDRAERVVVTASPAPRDLLGESFLDGMIATNADAMRLGAAGRAGHEELRARAERLGESVAGGLEQLLAGQALTPADEAKVRALGESVLAGVSEGFRSGPFGWVDDFVAMAGPWGFELSAIACPVVIEHGADDHNVPLAHARALAEEIAGSALVVHEQAGHFPDVADMLRRVLLAAGRPD